MMIGSKSWTAPLLVVSCLTVFIYSISAKESAPIDRNQPNSGASDIRQQLEDLLQQLGEANLISDFDVPPEFQAPQANEPSPVESAPGRLVDNDIRVQESVPFDLRRRQAELDLKLAQLRLEERELEVMQLRHQRRPDSPLNILTAAPRFSVVATGEGNAILVDSTTGHTWRISSHRNSWTRLKTRRRDDRI